MHIVLKRKTSLHKVIWSLAFWYGGTCYIFAQIQMRRKDFLIINLQTVIQWVIKHVGKQPYKWFFDNIGFPISGGHKIRFYLDGRVESNRMNKFCEFFLRFLGLLLKYIKSTSEHQKWHEMDLA